MSNDSDRRKQLKRQYRERPVAAGVYRVKNVANGRALLGSSLNVDGAINGHRFMLKMGSHRNRAMQGDWKTFGAESFVFEVLERVKVSEAPGFDVDGELRLLEEIWIEELQPFGEGSYNETERIRQA